MRRAFAGITFLAAIYSFADRQGWTGLLLLVVAIWIFAGTVGIGRLLGSVFGFAIYVAGNQTDERGPTRTAAPPSDTPPTSCSDGVENDAVTEAFQILGLAYGASSEQIRDSYRAKVAQCHPDKLDNMAPELKRYATRLTADITVAYDLLHKEGFV